MARFTPRTTAPATTDRRFYADNPFYQSGWGMPNCTCYAFGRFWELLDHKPDLSLGNAEDWWNYDDGYLRSYTPRLGSIMVWENPGDGGGHVAVVEQINADGSVRTSNSGYPSAMFYMQDIPATFALKDYKFLGFIHCPVDFSGTTIQIPEPISGNRYLTQAEMETNATYIYWYLGRLGWSINAVAALLGNMEAESTINPGIWESLDEGDTSQGFGLVQWTPATKYLNWCSAHGLEPAAMDSALQRIEYELEHGLQYIATSAYPLSFAEFKVSTKSPYYLGMAFVTNYERPRDITTARGTNAEKWYQFLLTLPSFSKRKRTSLPLWLLYTATRRRF